jgi:hypothetical protein
MRQVRRALAGVLFSALSIATTAAAQSPPQTVFVWGMGSDAQNELMSSVAGIVNRTTPEVLLGFPGTTDLPSPTHWLQQYQRIVPSVQSQTQNDPAWYLQRYRDRFSGYVLYDKSVNPRSLNVATSIAGVTNAIMVDASTLPYAVAANLPRVADARNMTYTQLISQYGSQFNRQKIFHQDPEVYTYQLRDYAIREKGLVFWSPNNMDPYFARQQMHGRVYGWGPVEVDLFAAASRRGQQVVASNWSWSSSTTAGWNVPVPPQPARADPGVPTQRGKHYVAFVMSDGDNVQWLTNGFSTDRRWFGSPHRGEFDMTWDLSPTLAEMNPLALRYLYENAANGPRGQDNFVTAHGVGTAFPSDHPDIGALADSIAGGMKLIDNKVLAMLDTEYDWTKLAPLMRDPQVLGMFFKTYDDFYKGRNGAIDFFGGKPIISAKYSLWDGADTAVSLAAALNADPNRDATASLASYSVVNVHPWSMLGPDGTGSGDPMANLAELVRRLNRDNVEVVTLEEMIVHLRNNFGVPVPEPVGVVTLLLAAAPLLGRRRQPPVRISR